jgi:hypothetical protein
MSVRLLSPDQNLQKIISLTRTDRWASAIRHHSDQTQRIAALDWNDLATECRQWPGSVAIIEVGEVNLEAACRFPLEHPNLRSLCALFAVTDFARVHRAQTGTNELGVLAMAGYQWICNSPLAAPRLFRQIERYQCENPPHQPPIEVAFRQRLPWKRIGRYADRQFKTTRFSVPSNDRHSESANHSEITGRRPGTQ